jgi:hypothetical protein
MSKELLKRVRDTLHELEETHYDLYWDIQTALDQPEQEPVAWRKWDGYGFYFREYDTGGEPLYLAPPKREPSITSREMYQRGYAAAERDLKRESLSEGELNSLYYQATNQTLREQDTRLAFEFARAIEKAHGIGIVE